MSPGPGTASMGWGKERAHTVPRGNLSEHGQSWRKWSCPLGASDCSSFHPFSKCEWCASSAPCSVLGALQIHRVLSSQLPRREDYAHLQTVAQKGKVEEQPGTCCDPKSDPKAVPQEPGSALWRTRGSQAGQPLAREDCPWGFHTRGPALPAVGAAGGYREHVWCGGPNAGSPSPTFGLSIPTCKMTRRVLWPALLKRRRSKIRYPLPWPLWLIWLKHHPATKRSLVQLLVRPHA